MSTKNQEKYNELFEKDWQRIGETNYIIKFKVSDEGYNVFVSDLLSLYGEMLGTEDIVIRFEESNAHVEMKPSIIIQNLKKSLNNLLYSNSESCITLNSKLICNLQFKVGPVHCHFEMKMDLLPQEMFTQYLIAPVVFSSLLYQEKFNELQKQCEIEFHRTFSPSKLQVQRSGVLNPDWLKGESIMTDVLCESFLKVQNNLRHLYMEASKFAGTASSDKLPTLKHKHFQNGLEPKNICKAPFLSNSDSSEVNDSDRKTEIGEPSSHIKEIGENSNSEGNTLQEDAFLKQNRKREISENISMPIKYEEHVSPIVKEEKAQDVLYQKPLLKNAKKKKLLKL